LSVEENETAAEVKVEVTKKKLLQSTTPIRVKKSTARSIRAILKKLNKKAMGKKIITDSVVSKAISLLTDEHFEALKVASYPASDHLEVRYQEYCKKNGSISKDKFIEMLLSADLPTS